MTDPIALVAPCVNRFDMFTEMIETVDTPVQPFIIDQWRYNRGVSAAWNLGMKRALDAGYRYAVVTNDDVKFYPGALRSTYNLLVDSGVALVSPNQIRKPQDPGEGYREGADFFCFAVDIPQLTAHAGWFDENIFPAYFEDNDMHMRMLNSGLKSYINQEANVLHEHSMTQKFDKKNPNTSSMAFEANKAYYVRKWGGMPSDERYATPFNHPKLSVKDWNGSFASNHFAYTKDNQDILNSIDSLRYEVPYGGIHYEKII